MTLVLLSQLAPDAKEQGLVYYHRNLQFYPQPLWGCCPPDVPSRLVTDHRSMCAAVVMSLLLTCPRGSFKHSNPVASEPHPWVRGLLRWLLSVSPSPRVRPAGWLAEQTPPTPTLAHGSVPFQSWRTFWAPLKGSLCLPFMALLPPANAIYLLHGFKSPETTAKEGNIYWQIFAVHPAATFPQTRKPELSRERKNIRTIIKTSRNGIHPHMW